MENRVTVSICGEEYTFVAEEAPSYMQKVGAYVGTKMDEMLTGAKVGRTDAAVLAAANIAAKRAAATAGGFCGLFGYGSTIVSGWGMGMLVQYTDWSVALYTLVGMALVGTAVFAAAWKAKPNGYDD